ncbi:MAG: phenylalanine--tRNA ligase subunit alpha [Parachlamydiales bacterium]
MSLDAIREEANGALEKIATLQQLEAFRVHYLGKKGPIQALMLTLREASPEERPQLGKAINDLKVELTDRCDALEARLASAEEERRLAAETLDITLPGKKRTLGRRHPVSLVMERVLEILSQMGFTVQYGPDIESDYHNFGALNFGPDHPARDMQDTFYLSPDRLLRTHTSNTQVRLMEEHGAPLRIAAPGRCFRNEEVTARSHLFFHQVEGLYIDKNVTFADLLATLTAFLQRLFGQHLKVRFRASYFPFVEPGLEADIFCLSCRGEGCKLCKNTGWLEILGAGLVHPNVLKNGGIDPETYSGYAWGMGIERIALLLYNIPDIRLLPLGDLRLLEQFC